jgi:predicted nucleotidyltransferase
MDQKLIAEPNKFRATQMLYIFAATGWFPALERFYEFMGDSRIAHSSRVEMSLEYKHWKELYTRKIHELLSENKAHFEDRGIDRSAVDFTRFDIYQRKYEAKKLAREEGKK